MLKPILCTAKDVASVLGLHERRVSELTRLGRFQKPYDLVACVKAYIDFLRQDAGGLKDQRLRATRLKADLLQLDYEQRVGSLVLRSAVDKVWFAETHRTRDNFLNLPARTAGLVSAEHNQQTCFDILMKEVVQILEGLTRDSIPSERDA